MRDDARHVFTKGLAFVLFHLDERRLVAPLERELLDRSDVVGVGVSDKQVPDVVDRQAEFGHLDGGLRAQIHEQGRVSLHDDEVRLEHLGRERTSDPQWDNAEMAVGGQGQFFLVAPDAHARGLQFGFVRAQFKGFLLHGHGWFLHFLCKLLSNSCF